MQKIKVAFLLLIAAVILYGCGGPDAVVDPKNPASSLNPAMPASEKQARLHPHAKSAG